MECYMLYVLGIFKNMLPLYYQQLVLIWHIENIQ